VCLLFSPHGLRRLTGCGHLRLLPLSRYVDEAQPVQERRGALVGYGFQCDCSKCVAEAEAEAEAANRKAKGKAAASSERKGKRAKTTR